MRVLMVVVWIGQRVVEKGVAPWEGQSRPCVAGEEPGAAGAPWEGQNHPWDAEAVGLPGRA